MLSPNYLVGGSKTHDLQGDEENLRGQEEPPALKKRKKNGSGHSLDEDNARGGISHGCCYSWCFPTLLTDGVLLLPPPATSPYRHSLYRKQEPCFTEWGTETQPQLTLTQLSREAGTLCKPLLMVLRVACSRQET